MKTLVIILMTLALGAAAWPASYARASCKDAVFHCRIEGKGKSIGNVTIGQCWSWKHGCDNCRGNKEPASHCNKSYPECQGKCWACYYPMEDYCPRCYEPNGNDKWVCN